MSEVESKINTLIDQYKPQLNCILYNLKEKDKYYDINNNYDNPDPEKLVPVQVNGFIDLLSRVKVQTESLNKAKESIKLLDKIISDMEGKQIELLRNEYETCQNKQIHLSHQLLSVMKKLEILKNRDMPLTSNEIEFQHRVQSIHNEINNIFKPRCEKLYSDLYLGRAILPITQPRLDSNSVNQLLNVLEMQTEELDVMSQSLTKDSEVIEISESLLNKM